MGERVATADVVVLSVVVVTVNDPDPPELSVRLDGETVQFAYTGAPEQERLTFPLNPVLPLNWRL